MSSTSYDKIETLEKKLALQIKTDAFKNDLINTQEKLIIAKDSRIAELEKTVGDLREKSI